MPDAASVTQSWNSRSPRPLSAIDLPEVTPLFGMLTEAWAFNCAQQHSWPECPPEVIELCGDSERFGIDALMARKRLPLDTGSYSVSQ